MHCMYSLKAEVSLSGRADTGRTKLTCMAVYSFLLSLLPSKMLSPSEGGGTIGPKARSMLIFLFSRACPSHGDGLRLKTCLSSRMLSPSEGGGTIGPKTRSMSIFLSSRACPSHGLRLKTCLSVTVYPNMMESFKFHSEIYKHHMHCPIANCILVGHNNDKITFNDPNCFFCSFCYCSCTTKCRE